MPTARLPGHLPMHSEDDAFTDPWSKPETIKTVKEHVVEA
jgi:hypothetical protein